MDTSRKVLVLGATTNPERYAYRAAESLTKHGFDIIPVGVRKGAVFEKTILNDKSLVPEVHTVTLYVGPANLVEWEDYIIALTPKRVIFNPGTENKPFEERLQKEGIEVEEACTLVLLNLGAF